jgi:endonuclease-3 related protein
VGAILTQNTSWSNVEKALAVLRERRRLSFRGLEPLRASQIAPLVRSSGTHRVKARRLRAFLDFLGHEYGGSVARMRRDEPGDLRRKLLAVHGIGPETADSIALYAAGKPLFVVDAYTRRVFGRLGTLHGRERYDDVQRVFMDALPREAPLFNDYHAQIVRLAKEACRPRPRCTQCPLVSWCPRQGIAEAQSP